MNIHNLIRLFPQLLGHAPVVWLPREVIWQNLQNVFRKEGYSNCRVILDCAEVFIEWSKSLRNQAYAWSDFKHHNTIKLLVGISPNGFITFLLDGYGGRASDKYLTKDSDFYDLLERDDEVMGDRGFRIKEQLILHFCSLEVRPGARIKCQMTSVEVKKPKDVVNLRIHVERVINQIKSFRILKNTQPVSLLQHIDDILWTCAALCNVKPKTYLFKERKRQINSLIDK